MTIEKHLCSLCGKEFDRSYLTSVDGNTKLYCSQCLEHTFHCPDCGRYFSLPYEEIYTVEDDRQVCELCFENNYSYCDVCGRYVYYDDFDSGADICYSCQDKQKIKSYHYNKGYYTMFGNGPWHIGVELEVDNGCCKNECAEKLDNVTQGRLFFEEDGSLSSDGFEIITQPHTLKEFTKIPWSEIFKICKSYGFTSHNAGTCGLHIHLSKSFFGKQDLIQRRAIAKTILFYEVNFLELLKASRRTEKQVKDYASSYNLASKNLVRSLTKPFTNLSQWGRYKAVNLCNRNTVEFRLGRGTLNEESFWAWIDLTLTICKNAKKVTWANATLPQYMLQGIKSETQAYLKKINAFQNAGEVQCA